MLISDVLISFKSKLLVIYVIESWNAGKWPNLTCKMI